MIYYCNKCNKSMLSFEMNDLELKEYEEEGSFVCSDCINEEMMLE